MDIKAYHLHDKFFFLRVVLFEIQVLKKSVYFTKRHLD